VRFTVCYATFSRYQATLTLVAGCCATTRHEDSCGDAHWGIADVGRGSQRPYLPPFAVEPKPEATLKKTAKVKKTKEALEPEGATGTEEAKAAS
jgi:hypothetical protein